MHKTAADGKLCLDLQTRQISTTCPRQLKIFGEGAARPTYKIASTGDSRCTRQYLRIHCVQIEKASTSLPDVPCGMGQAVWASGMALSQHRLQSACKGLGSALKHKKGQLHPT